MNVPPALKATPPSILHRLPPALFSLVSQFLPLPDKLLQLTHVCCTFPALTPPSFAFDTLAWTAPLVAQLSRTPVPPLLSLLSQVPRGLFVESSDDFLPQLSRLVDPPSAPCPFSGLRAVTVAPTRCPPGWFIVGELSSFPLASLRHCPGLSALSVDLWNFSREGQSALLSCLHQLRSLKDLRVSSNLTAEQFLLLLSLPLTSLDLHASRVFLLTPPPSPFPVLPRFRTLLFPSLDDDFEAPSPAVVSQWGRAVLSSLTTQGEQGQEPTLERLHVDRSFSTPILPYVSLFRRLHTLQLFVPLASDNDDVLNLYSALIASPLPLRHLRLEHSIASRRADTPRSSERSKLFLSLFPAFVSAYAGQLLTLDIPVDPLIGFDTGQMHSPIPATAAAEFTVALLSCRHLRRLLVTDWWLSSKVPVPPVPAFPDLESLELQMDKTIDMATLALLLDAAPHLQELTLEVCHLSFFFIQWIGSRCHELRTLQVREGYNTHEVDERVLRAIERRQALPSFPDLPHLRTLIFLSALSSDFYPDLPVSSFTRFVHYLVHSAPAIRYLSLPYLQWLDGYREPLTALVGLTQLRGLSLPGQDWWRKGQLARYWKREEQLHGSRVQRERARDGWSIWETEACPRPTMPWRVTVDSDEYMRGWARSDEEVEDVLSAGWIVPMPQFKEEVDGQTGAVAFFAAVQASSSIAARVRRNSRRTRDEGGESKSDDEEEERGEKRSRVA